MSYDPQKDHDEEKARVERLSRLRVDYSGVYTGKGNGEMLISKPHEWKSLPKLPPVGKPPIKQK
jgi:hypothetical protein